MRYSTIRNGAAAIAAAAALAACGGHGVVPAQNFASEGANGVVGSVMPEAKASPCDVQGMYYFQGSCRAFTLYMAKTTTVKLGQFGAYHGIKVTTSFIAPQGKPAFTGGPQGGSIAAVMGDAIGDGDVQNKVKNQAFKLYGDGKDCVYANKPATCPGKPFMYAELINQSKYTLKPALTPKFVITDTNGFPVGPKKQCFPAELTSKGWLAQTNLYGTPKGNVLTINALSNSENLSYPANSQFIVAGVCY